jgi:hypothetical protein
MAKSADGTGAADVTIRTRPAKPDGDGKADGANHAKSVGDAPASATDDEGEPVDLSEVEALDAHPDSPATDASPPPPPPAAANPAQRTNEPSSG